ncbi:MAG: hypothetical protein V9E87_12530 [Gemmatimonadales bacterium]
MVDTSAQFERKLKAVACYASQFTPDTIQAGELYPTGQPLLELIRTQDAHAGSLIRAAYGEPFWTAETMAVDDITRLGRRLAVTSPARYQSGNSLPHNPLRRFGQPASLRDARPADGSATPCPD